MSSNATPLFNTQGVYSFQTLSPAILGARLENAKCEAELTYDACMAMGFNVGSTYRTIYPSLPNGTPDIPKLLRYYLFTTQAKTDGSAAAGRVIICEQWVDTSTIELIEFVNFTIRFERQKPSDIQRISSILRGAGYTGFQIQER